MGVAWHERDGFWHTFEAQVFSAEEWRKAPAEVERGVDLLALPPGSAVLDLACGPGRHTLELARRGYAVTGVDRTRRYLAAARARAERASLAARVRFLQADMCRLPPLPPFDAALSLYASFGYFEEPAEDERVLRAIHGVLKPGGLLLMELIGKEMQARDFRARDEFTQDGVTCIQERAIRDSWGRVETRWTRLEGGRRRSYVTSLRLYSAAELTALLRAIGFREVTAYGSLEGTPYDEHARRHDPACPRPPARLR